jgi:dihydroorotate dehydrogenase
VGDRLVLVAAGGIDDADDAWERICAGATFVQLYTGFVYGGPGTPARVARGLAARLRAEGRQSVREAVGCAAIAAVKTLETRRSA